MSRSNPLAEEVLNSWAAGEWLLSRPEMPETMELMVFKVDGETNTDDLSPATEAWSRPDIPLHAKSMLISKMERPVNFDNNPRIGTEQIDFHSP